METKFLTEADRAQVIVSRLRKYELDWYKLSGDRKIQESALNDKTISIEDKVVVKNQIAQINKIMDEIESLHNLALEDFNNLSDDLKEQIYRQIDSQ